MDHVILPSDPIRAAPKVSYVCDAPFDGSEWLSYPARVGWPQAVPSALYPQFSKYELAHPSDDYELAKFFQSWIFFGLLCVILKDYNLYDPEEYIDKDFSGRPKYIHTRKLIERLNQWRSIVGSYSQDQKFTLYEMLVGNLRRAEDCLRVLHRFPSATYYGPEKYHPKFDRAMKASLTSLCHLLVCTIDAALLDGGPSSSPNSWADIGWDDVFEQEMKLFGWCPSETGAVRREFKTLAAQMYLQHMRKPDLGMHTNCKEGEDCDTATIKEGYKPRHINNDCSCDSVGPDMEAVLATLTGKRFPILGIDGTTTENLSVRTVPSDDETPYVALSHVWADGLGNKTANDLPRCQLAYFQSLLARMRDHVGWNQNRPDGRELRIWCDTLLCPVVTSLESEERKTRLELGKQDTYAKMAEIYKGAAYVLVLDPCLYLYDFDQVGPLEAGLRIFSSRWWRRLWTFQEAVLASSLVFLFRDRIVDLRTIWQQTKNIHESSNLATWALSLDVIMLCRSVRVFLHLNGGPDLPAVVERICYRGVSYPNDEPLCVNTVLQLDPVSMAKASAELRMVTLWQNMKAVRRGIPKTIIFNALPRLCRKGYGWAPSTFRQSITTPPQFVSSSDDSPNAQGTLIEGQGLVVAYPAWKIRMATPPMGIPPNFWGVGNENTLRLRTEDGLWYWVQKHPSKLSPEEHTLGGYKGFVTGADGAILIIESTAPVKADPRFALVQALLVTEIGPNEDKSVASNVIHVHSAMVISVSLAKPNEAALWQTTFDAANRLRQEPAVTTLRNLSGETQEARNRAFNGALQQLMDRVQSLANENAQSEQVATLCRNAGSQNPAGLFGALMISWLMGRYLVIEQTYGAEQMWCVD